MGQYRLWLQQREVEQNLRKQQITCKQELSEIDEHIARIEKTTRQTSNALLTALMQHINMQKPATSQRTDTTGAQSEYNGATQETAHAQKYQTPPPSNYGQQMTPVSPPLLAWSHLPNFDTQDISISEEEILSADVIPVLPEEKNNLLPGDFSTLFEQEKPEENQASLPWWLRRLMQNNHEEQKPQEIASIDQQDTDPNQRVERWFARRTRLLHYNEWQEDQKK